MPQYRISVSQGGPEAPEIVLLESSDYEEVRNFVHGLIPPSGQGPLRVVTEIGELERGGEQPARRTPAQQPHQEPRRHAQQQPPHHEPEEEEEDEEPAPTATKKPATPQDPRQRRR